MATPSVNSAAAVAVAISRRLRKAGFHMADTSDRYNWSDGFIVYRVGCSNEVTVSYHLNHRHMTVEDRNRAGKEYAEARKFLVDAGYTLMDRSGIYIKCRSE